MQFTWKLVTRRWNLQVPNLQIDGSVQDCSISNAKALEILQSCTKPLKWAAVTWLTHWVTHICVGNLTIIGSDNGFSPGRPQAITWTNVDLLSVGSLGAKFSEIPIEIQNFSFMKMRIGKCRLRNGGHFVQGKMSQRVGTSLVAPVLASRVAFHKQFFHHNSNLMKISFYSHPNCTKGITMKFCTWQDSCAIVACEKFGSNMIPYTGVTLN